MDTSNEKINLGFIGTSFGKLSFSLIINQSKNAYLFVYANTPNDLRKAGVGTSFSYRNFLQFSQIINQAEEKVNILINSQEIVRLRWPYDNYREEKQQFEIGRIRSNLGEFIISVSINLDNYGHIMIFAIDPSDRRKSGVLIRLDDNSLLSLKELLKKVSDEISQYKNSGRILDI